MSGPFQTPFDLGKAAFAAGSRRIAPMAELTEIDVPVGTANLDPVREWYRGWDAANLAQPV